MTSPRVVLGIDAAWTATNPSGVAVVVGGAGGWKLAACEASYPSFLGVEGGHVPNAQALLERAERLAGAPVDLAAIDMPLSRSPIVGRRVSDNQVSAAYGDRWCSTHTPSRERPGRISDDLREGFGKAGYRLATAAPAGRALVEVYPHTALVELMGADRRLEYKVAKAGRYWRGEAPAARRDKLVAVWRSILEALEGEIAGVGAALALPDPAAAVKTLKAFEDRLDAVVCAFVGVCVLEGRARALGDGESAIWTPVMG